LQREVGIDAAMEAASTATLVAPERRTQSGTFSGVVEFFNSARGYGFVTRENAENLFFHMSNVNLDGGAEPEIGQTVQYEIGEGRRGDEAMNLR
jgi:CspA family cold shock protein